jgi:hypothetical protein
MHGGPSTTSRGIRRADIGEIVMPLDAEKRRQRARLAALRRHHPDDLTVGLEEHRDFKAGAAERYVQELVDSWPPLTDTQRSRLAVLLLGGGNDDHGSTSDQAGALR